MQGGDFGIKVGSGLTFNQDSQLHKDVKRFPMKNALRKGLSAPGMYGLIRRHSQTIPDHRNPSYSTISLSDAVMSATAMFSLKSPSMLQFCNEMRDDTIDNNIRHNTQQLFNVSHVPSDTAMREILDPVPTHELQKCFKLIFSEAQRGKVLEKYPYLDKKYLLSIDGTGFFSSSKVHCDNCGEKNHRDGTTTYYHQMLSGAIVHPSHKEVIPIASEPIAKQDGSRKNDCERVAAERLLRGFRQDHPHLPVIVLEDGLASNAPHIRLLQELDCSYILGCKQGDHKALFEFVQGAEKLGSVHHVTIKEGETRHRFRFINQIPLNEANPDCLVNFVEYEESKENGKTLRFSWVTDIELNKDNLMQIMRGGRARWRIENEVFNTLKNLGYNFEHNFGHGHQNLSNNLAILMMLVFLVDQILMLACQSFKAALNRAGRLSYLWRRMRNYFETFLFKDWNELFSLLAYGIRPTWAASIIDTS